MMMPVIDGPPGAALPAPPPPNKFAGTMVMETPMPPMGGAPPPAPPPPTPFGGHAGSPLNGPMSQQPDSDREDRTMLAPNLGPMGPGMPPPMTMQTMIGAPLGGPPVDRDSAFEGGGRTMMASFPEMSASMGLGSMGAAQPEPIRIQAFVDPSASPPVPAGPPAPAAQYAAMVNAAMASQPEPKRTPWGLIIAVVVLVAAGVGCGVYFLTRAGSEVEEETISIPTAREAAEPEEKQDTEATSAPSSTSDTSSSASASASAAAPKPLLTAKPKPAPAGEPKPAPTGKPTSQPGGGFLKKPKE